MYVVPKECIQVCSCKGQRPAFYWLSECMKVCMHTDVATYNEIKNMLCCRHPTALGSQLLVYISYHAPQRHMCTHNILIIQPHTVKGPGTGMQLLHAMEANPMHTCATIFSCCLLMSFASVHRLSQV